MIRENHVPEKYSKHYLKGFQQTASVNQQLRAKNQKIYKFHLPVAKKWVLKHVFMCGQTETLTERE